MCVLTLYRTPLTIYLSNDVIILYNIIVGGAQGNKISLVSGQNKYAPCRCCCCSLPIINNAATKTSITPSSCAAAAAVVVDRPSDHSSIVRARIGHFTRPSGHTTGFVAGVSLLHRTRLVRSFVRFFFFIICTPAITYRIGIMFYYMVAVRRLPGRTRNVSLRS